MVFLTTEGNEGVDTIGAIFTSIDTRPKLFIRHLA